MIAAFSLVKLALCIAGVVGIDWDDDARVLDAVLGESSEVQCDAATATGTTVTWRRWTRRGAEWIAAERIDERGSLLFNVTGKEDEGLYRCSVVPHDSLNETLVLQEDSTSLQEVDVSTSLNHSQPQSETGLSQHGPAVQLRVLVRPVLTDYPQSQRVEPGSQVHLRCSATGDPVPQITWFRDGEQIEGAAQVDLVPWLTQSVLGVNVTGSANYTCRASNLIRGEMASHQHSFLIQLQSDYSDAVKEEDKEPSGYCAPYTGKTCRRHLNSLVWYNVSNERQGGWLNEQVVAGLWEEVIESLKEPCRSAAEKLMCLYAFPQCHLERSGYPRRLPLCYEDCVATRQLFCVNQWSLLESNNERGIYLGSRGHFRLPRCEDLPRISDSQATPTCSRANLTRFVDEEVTTTCVRGHGRFYQGNVSVTKDGIPCQRWDSQVPHSHNRPPINVFPEMQGAENYCRNAGGDEPRPWCYTADPLVRWQHCNIPQCEGEAGAGDNPSQGISVEQMDLSVTPGSVLLLSCISFFSLLLLFLVLYFCQRTLKRKRSSKMTVVQTLPLDIDLRKLPDNAAYHYVGTQVDPSLEKLEYPRNDIIYIKDLGQGAFGRVFQAKAPSLIKGEPFTIVAVKTLKEEADEDMRADFEKEACLLAEFDHPNIIRLLGVCAVGKPMCLLLEFMSLGDLNEYLRSCSPSNYIVKTSDAHHMMDVKLSALELTAMGRQIAAGMVYLSQRGFVHRDLATRNCLVNQDLVVKIADFGLSQRLQRHNYYRGTENDAIPIRWMPLESILYNRYTSASDVWAFGICLWEIFSFGLQPYYGMTHEEVVRFIQGGGILEPPHSAPCAIYAIMRSCWQGKASDRPVFESILEELMTIEEALTRNQSSDPAPTHV